MDFPSGLLYLLLMYASCVRSETKVSVEIELLYDACGPYEHYDECAGCDYTCEFKNVTTCPFIACEPGCKCYEGYVRDGCKCIPAVDCPYSGEYCNLEFKDEINYYCVAENLYGIPCNSKIQTGIVVYASCAAGYFFVPPKQSFQLTCDENGKWSPEVAPRCVKDENISCEFSKLKAYDVEYRCLYGMNPVGCAEIMPSGSVVFAECISGYEDIAQEDNFLPIACVNGNWSKAPPVCVLGRTPCQRLESPVVKLNCLVNEYYSPCEPRIPHGSHVMAECRNHIFEKDVLNYEMIMCDNGVWTGKIPTCNLNDTKCDALESEDVDFTCYQGDDKISCDEPVPIGTIAEPVCKPLYESKTVLHVLKCVEGEWSKALPKCELSNLGKIIIEP